MSICAIILRKSPRVARRSMRHGLDEVTSGNWRVPVFLSKIDITVSDGGPIPLRYGYAKCSLAA